MNIKRAKAMIEIGASSKGLDRGLADAKKKMRGFQSAMKGLGGLAKGALGAVGGGVGIALGGGIVDTIASAGAQVADYEMALTRFQVAGSRSADQMGQLRADVDRVSSATALGRQEILAGAASYVALTGDANGAAAAMEAFARIAQASGSQVSDVATAAAALRDNLKLNPADFEKAFSSLIAQGKAGAVEVKDLAGELASLAPQFAQFKTMGGIEGVAELGASFQVVRKGFGSASEAATGLRSMMTSMVANAEKFEKAGVRIFDKDPRTGAKTMRKLSDIWGDINDSKLVKDPTALGKTFGREEARRAYETFLQHKDLYGDLITAAKDYGTVNRDLATVMESPAGKLQKTFNDMKLAIAEAFTPERIAAFAEALSAVVGLVNNVVKGISAIASWMANPVKTAQDTSFGLKSGIDQMLAQKGMDMQYAKFKLREAAKGHMTKEGTFTDQAAADKALKMNIIRARAEGKQVDDLDVWGVNTGANNPYLAKQAGPNQEQFNRAIAIAISKAPISVQAVLKMDTSAVAKELNNNKDARAKRGGH